MQILAMLNVPAPWWLTASRRITAAKPDRGRGTRRELTEENGFEYEKLLEEGLSGGEECSGSGSEQREQREGAGASRATSAAMPTRWTARRALKQGLAALAVLVLVLLARTSYKRFKAHRSLAALESSTRSLVAALSIQPPLNLSSEDSLPSGDPLSAACLADEALQIALHARKYSTPTCSIKAGRLLLYQDLLRDADEHIFIAMILYNNQNVLPTFMQELPRLIGLLGRDRVFVSIYENGSTDLT